MTKARPARKLSSVTDQPPPARNRGIGPMMQLAGLGFELIVTIALLAGAGYALDRWLGWFPAGTIGGIVLGCVVGMINLIRSSLRALRDGGVR